MVGTFCVVSLFILCRLEAIYHSYLFGFAHTKSLAAGTEQYRWRVTPLPGIVLLFDRPIESAVKIGSENGKLKCEWCGTSPLQWVNVFNYNSLLLYAQSFRRIWGSFLFVCFWRELDIISDVCFPFFRSFILIFISNGGVDEWYTLWPLRSVSRSPVATTTTNDNDNDNSNNNHFQYCAQWKIYLQFVYFISVGRSRVLDAIVTLHIM